MRLCNNTPLVVLAAVAVIFAPIAVRSADAPAPSPLITVTATRPAGAEAVTISGKAPAGESLEAALYARFSEDLPTVLLSRRPIVPDANGRYTATLSAAPAYFRNAIVTVVVQSPASGASARASFAVTPPNVPAPPDQLPASVR